MKTRLLQIGVLLFFAALLLSGGSPTLLRRVVAGPSVFLLRSSIFFLDDFFQFAKRSLLIEENRLLKRDLASVKKDLSFLREEIRTVRGAEILLSFQKAHPERESLFCRIIGRNPSHWSQTVILDRGRGGGMESDMAVLGTQGLVGRVVEVEEGWSKALLLTDPDSKVGAILERSRESGLLVGGGRGLLTLEYLSPGADVREGDRVLTAGFGSIFPKGILVGEVVGFGMREETLLLYALVKPAEHLTQLEEVLCVRKK